MTRISRIGALAFAAVLLAACSRGVGAGGTASPTAPASGGVQLKVTQSTLGMILTDASGRTLYAFTKDANGKSACNGNCSATWPALSTAAGQKASAGDGVTAEWISSITRDDGTTQVTYGGHPVYFYAPDTIAGDTKGQGVGGLWFVVGADGQLIGAPGAGSSASPSASASAKASLNYGY